MITHACVKFYTKEVISAVSGKPTSKCYTIPCHRHGDAFAIIAQFLDPDEIDKTKTEQGFLTHDGTFLDRTQAYFHAKESGQIASDYRLDKVEPQLYSEDLW